MPFDDKLSKCFTLFESRSDIIRSIDDLLKSLNIPSTLIGGAALQYYNYNRNTDDIDIVLSVEDAYKFGDSLLKTGKFEFVGHNKFKHKCGLDINLCPSGTQAGHNEFQDVKDKTPGLHIIDLPDLLAMKIKAKRLKDRGDYAELVKRNKLSNGYINEKVLPLLNDLDKKWAIKLFDEAQKEL